eukprot:TRINITY_DN3744_c0_g3_i1.p1 TRINITY_DN3744_c0_g3~~TRINITY_DN3744_c0_g3_i1.p1  ORF type:complete len:125 (-),score=20.06 TRINITY_DN3744_c0_g3_i1:126-500(-)
MQQRFLYINRSLKNDEERLRFNNYYPVWKDWLECMNDVLNRVVEYLDNIYLKIPASNKKEMMDYLRNRSNTDEKTMLVEIEDAVFLTAKQFNFKDCKEVFSYPPFFTDKRVTNQLEVLINELKL